MSQLLKFGRKFTYFFAFCQTNCHFSVILGQKKREIVSVDAYFYHFWYTIDIVVAFYNHK